MSLEAAFNYLTRLQSREVSYVRGVSSYTLRISPTSYDRNMEVVADMELKGRQFIISKSAIELHPTIVAPKRADRIIDPELGMMVIDDVEPLYALGGAIIGWRVRTS